MQFIDLAAQQSKIRRQIELNLGRVLDHGRYIMGPEIGQLEDELVQFCGVPHAIGCGSGTDALLLALMALDVGPGDAIFCPTFTFVATAEVISLLGATPVFVDVNPTSFNMEPHALAEAIQAVRKCDPKLHPLPASNSQPLRPKAVIVVDLFGLPADYDAIGKIAAAEQIMVIEDAAQSFGAEFNGRRAGSLAPLAATSFFPAKPLGCYGDGGMVFCRDAGNYQTMRSLRVHGQGSNKYDNVRIGLNARLDTIQASVLLAKLEIFDDELQKRQEVAARYQCLLESNPLIQTPVPPPGYYSAWAQYTVLAPDPTGRERICGKLGEAGIPTAVYYPKPLHLQRAFQYLGYKQGHFPVSEDLALRVFSLPMHPYLQPDSQNQIAEALAAC